MVKLESPVLSLKDLTHRPEYFIAYIKEKLELPDLDQSCRSLLNQMLLEEINQDPIRIYKILKDLFLQDRFCNEVKSHITDEDEYNVRDKQLMSVECVISRLRTIIVLNT